jgi:hypothetical protein
MASKAKREEHMFKSKQGNLCMLHIAEKKFGRKLPRQTSASDPSVPQQCTACFTWHANKAALTAHEQSTDCGQAVQNVGSEIPPVPVSVVEPEH